MKTIFSAGVTCAVFVTCVCISTALAQNDVSPSAPDPDPAPALARRPAATAKPLAAETIPLVVPKGTALQVVLDKEVRIQKVGQPIRGRIAAPVYAFDRLVLAVGTEVGGQITQIEGVSGGKRTLEALNADFTPPRQVQIEFNDLVIDGHHRPMRTTVTPGSGGVIQFVGSADADKKKGPKDAASAKARQAKEQAKREWDNAMQQVHEPDKMHKIERYGVSQLPVHPQYIDAGTVYFADLAEPLDFGTEPLTPEMAASIGAPPPGSFVHARLLTALNSATTQNGERVDAVLSEPLFNGTRLLLPQGTHLEGSVVQVRPARRLRRNGQLRLVFHRLVLPDGIEQEVDTTLEGVQSSKGQDVKLDSEGGSEANSPKTRYLSTGVSVALALASGRGDEDAGPGNISGNTTNRVAGGAGGFKLVGILLGALVRSQPLGMAMGAYGAGMSVYAHFLARGRDVIFPKNTAMEIGVGTRAATPNPPQRLDSDKP